MSKIKMYKTVSRDVYETIGREIAQEFIDKGARELLAQAEEMTK